MINVTNDTFALLRSGSYLAATGNVALSLGLAMGAVVLGYLLGKGS